jgi:hypothetical protein
MALDFESVAVTYLVFLMVVNAVFIATEPILPPEAQLFTGGQRTLASDLNLSFEDQNAMLTGVNESTGEAEFAGIALTDIPKWIFFGINSASTFIGFIFKMFFGWVAIIYGIKDFFGLTDAIAGIFTVFFFILQVIGLFYVARMIRTLITGAGKV